MPPLPGYFMPREKQIRSGFLLVRTVPVLGLVLLGLEPRTAPPGTRAGEPGTSSTLLIKIANIIDFE
jgi:hypothetical protein